MDNESVEELPDVRLLHLFDVLYETGSVTRSAQRLGISQPTASIHLARLRSQVQDQLFVRTPSGMSPTPRADRLIGPCREILLSLRRFSSRAVDFEPATARRRFRIAMTDASHVTLLPALLTQVRGQAPGIGLQATRLDDDTEHALAAGEFDLAIGYAPWLGAGINRQRLYEQDWVCLASPGHPRGGDPLTVERYRAEGHVVVPGGTGGHLLDQGLARAGVERQVVVELPGFLGLGSIVRSTDLIATLPRHTGETLARGNGLVVHTCPVAVDTFTVRQHWHPRYHDEPAHRWLRGVVAGLFGGPAGPPGDEPAGDVH